jgi:hypothetical protein
VHVYEAGRHDETGGVDGAAGSGGREIAQRCDGVALNPDVGAASGRARSIDERAAAKDQVEVRLLRGHEKKEKKREPHERTSGATSYLIC